MVDILLAVYNGERFLEEQIESIFNQTYKNFRLIIVDDASTDNSMKIVEKYNFKNVLVFKNKKNLGPVKTFEKALRKSTSKLIAFCDQDDIWREDKLERQVNEILKYQNIPTLVHSDLEMIDENGNILEKSYFKFRKYNLPEKKALNKIISQNGVMGNTILMNEELKKLVLPFPEFLEVHDYWIAVVNELFGKRITIKEPLVKYRIHSDNVSNNKNIFSRQIRFSKKLPYTGINREKVLEELLERFEVSKEDEKIIKAFLDYLYFDKNRFEIFYNLIKYSFLKEDFWYRLKIFFKILMH